MSGRYLVVAAWLLRSAMLLGGAACGSETATSSGSPSSTSVTPAAYARQCEALCDTRKRPSCSADTRGACIRRCTELLQPYSLPCATCVLEKSLPFDLWCSTYSVSGYVCLEYSCRAGDLEQFTGAGCREFCVDG